MKAMIFAAGMGTRLRPLTNDKPKALIEVNGVPMLELVIKRIKKFGFDNIIINVHHFADKIIRFLDEKNNFDTSITIADETEKLLDTGGGLQKAAYFFNDNQPFLVHNVDILSDINLTEMYDFHRKNNALVTLAVQNRATSRSLLFDENNCLAAWKNNISGEMKVARYAQEMSSIAFSGIQIIDPKIFDFITETGVFSIIDVYLRLAKKNSIIAYNHNYSNWFDLGKPQNIVQAEEVFGSLA